MKPLEDWERRHKHDAEFFRSRVAELEEALSDLYDRCEEMRLNHTDPAGVGEAMKIALSALSHSEPEDG